MNNIQTNKFNLETTHPGRWWQKLNTGNFRCDLCPRQCELKPGQRGFCFVRKADENGINLTSYGQSSGFCIDPIEKKPLNHFYPGSSVLSFGTVGCNLGCQFCQNWDISKVRKQARLLDSASPEQIAEFAEKHGCRSVAFTYNDPTIFAEYAIDTAVACHARDIKTVAVTAGYIGKSARAEFFSVMDAVNVDLKGFTEIFYEKRSLAKLAPVLDTLKFIRHETKCWLELTNLIIPGENDSPEELKAMCEWIVKNLGINVPIHFTAFHPDFRMKDIPPTPHTTLLQARSIALESGIQYVYVGNVHDKEAGSTWCPHCKKCLIDRDWYKLSSFHIKNGCCEYCNQPVAGVFADRIGHWGRKRKSIQMNA